MERYLKFRLEYDPEYREGSIFFSACDKQLQAALASDKKFQRRFDTLYNRFREIVTELFKTELDAELNAEGTHHVEDL